MMNVFAGERIVESFLLGAVGYVNPYGNYIPRASHRIWDFLIEGRIEDAKRIQRLINRDATTSSPRATRPTATSATRRRWRRPPGYPVGDVRPPLTTFAELGEEGRARASTQLTAIMRELDALMDELDGSRTACAGRLRARARLTGEARRRA